MGANCCHDKEKDLELTARRHRKVLWTVLLINLAMFVVEFGTGVIAQSLALVGDSLDMLGDAITYGSSIWAVGLATLQKAKVARLKAFIMLAFAGIIAVRAVQKVLDPTLPDFTFMLSIGFVALCANLLCLYLLTKHKEDDVNMKSVWICSRNDIVANVSVLIAAGAVFYTSSILPDLIVGIGLTILFSRSALSIFRDADAAVANIVR